MIKWFFKSIAKIALLLLVLVGALVWYGRKQDDAPYTSRSRPAADQTKSVAPAQPNLWEIPENIDKQPARLSMIKEFQRDGLIQKIEIPAKYPRVFVTPAFMLSDYDAKKAVIDVVLSYYLIESKGDIDKLMIKHSITGKQVGSASAMNGFRMD